MNVLLLIYIDSNPRSTLGTRDFFSRVTRSFVSCRATRLRPEDETETGNRAWKVSGTQGIHAVALQIKCNYYFSSFRNSIKVSKLVAQKSPHKAFQSNFISLKTYLTDILLFSFAILIITLFTHLFTFGDFDFWLVKGSSKRNCVITNCDSVKTILPRRQFISLLFNWFKFEPGVLVIRRPWRNLPNTPMQLIPNRRTGTSKRLWNPTLKQGSHISPRSPESQTDVLPLPSLVIKIVIFRFKFEKCVQLVLAWYLIAQVFECEPLVVVAWATGQDLKAIVVEWCFTSLLQFD